MNETNTNIASLQTIIVALEKKDYIRDSRNGKFVHTFESQQGFQYLNSELSVRAGMLWNFSFSRNYQSGSQKLSNQDSDSGIMSVGK